MAGGLEKRELFFMDTYRRRGKTRAQQRWSAPPQYRVLVPLQTESKEEWLHSDIQSGGETSPNHVIQRTIPSSGIVIFHGHLKRSENTYSLQMLLATIPSQMATTAPHCGWAAANPARIAKRHGR